MAFYSRRAEGDRKQRDTPDRIMQISRSKGMFTVSLRYRDDWLRRRCKNLRKQGLLRGGHKVEHGMLVFYPVEA